MKKYLYTVLILIFCFLSSSFSLILLQPFRREQAEEDTSYVRNQKLYAVIEAVQNYDAEIQKTDSIVIDRLADVLASSMIVDYSAVETQLAGNPDSITVSAYFIDFAKAALKNSTNFDFSAYSDYIPSLSADAMAQIYNFKYDENLYTKERQIEVSFAETDSEKQTAVFNEEEMLAINEECTAAAEQIYSDYISHSDISTAFLLESIKNLALDDITEIYNSLNPESPIESQSDKGLFTAYAKHYLSNMIITDILISSSDSKTYTAVLTYETESGTSTINNVFDILLNTYYINKQPPVDKDTVKSDFAGELLFYSYRADDDLQEKTFNFTYSQSLGEFEINDDFYSALVNEIYEEYLNFAPMLKEYYQLMENEYFFVERPFDRTTVILDETGDTRYRQLNIKITGATDCYVKLYSYNTVTDTYEKLVFLAYIKSGETLEVFIDEGDYVFKYATGQAWYGDVYMFSDEGQYLAGSNVISVHEYMMTTTIELGIFDEGSVSAYSQTPDEF